MEAKEVAKHKKVVLLMCWMCLSWCSVDAVEFMIPLLCFRKLLRQVDLVKKKLVKRDEKRTNQVTTEKEQPVCSRPHVFLQR